MVDLGHVVSRVDAVRIGVVTDLGDRGAQLEERNGLRQFEGLVEQPGGAERRIEVRIVAVLVGIHEGGRPVVTAGELEEEHVAVGSGGLSHEGKHRLGAADGAGTRHRVAGVVDVVLVRHDQTAVGVRSHGEHVVVVVFTTEETADVPVFIHLEVEDEVGVEVGLLLGALAQAVVAVTALVGIARVGALDFLTGVVVVEAAVGNPFEPGSELHGEFEVRADDRLLLEGFVLPDVPPHAAAGDAAPLVTVGAVGDTAVRALVLVAEVLGVVGTVPGTVDEELTDVRLGIARGRVGEVHRSLDADGVVELVRSLDEGAEAVEAVVGQRTGGILLGNGSIDGAALVAAGDGHVGVGVETEVVGFLEVVGESLRRDALAVVPLDFLVFVETVTEGKAGGADVTGEFQQGRHVVGTVGPHVHVVDIPVGCAVKVAAVASEVTFHEHVLQRRLAGHLVDAEGLGEAHAEALGTLAAFGGDDDGTVQTAGTVEGRSGGTFQDGDGLEVVGVEVLQRVAVVEVVGAPVGAVVDRLVVEDDAVDHEDRLVVVAQGRCATDQDLVVAEHTAVGCVDLDTGHFALNGGDRVDEVGVQLIALDLGHRITQRFGSTLDAEGGDHGAFQHLGVFRQDHVDRAAVVGHDLRHEADAGNLDAVAHLHIVQRKITVNVHGGTVGLIPLHVDERTDDSFAGSVLHGSGNGRLRIGGEAGQQQGEGHRNTNEQVFHVQ